MRIFVLIPIICFGFFTAAYADLSRAENKPVPMSLDETILLAVRSNPNVQISHLDYLVQKFNLHVQEWQFMPHYAFQASAAIGHNRIGGQPFVGNHNFNVQPSVSLLTPIGTQITVSSTNPRTSHFNAGLSAQIVQPLMRGFGKAVVEQALKDACDSEFISRLNIENILRSTVTDVIKAYLNILTAEQTILIDEEALKRAQDSVEQTRLYIKAGHKAGNELITVQANVASAQSSLENDKNNLLQAQYALLTAIGVDPNINIRFSNLNVAELIAKYHVPTLEETKSLTLENDIQYQIDNITLHGSKTRALVVANDNTRWKLNLSASASVGNGSGGGINSGFNSLFNGANQEQGVGLILEIPIDDQPAKQAVFDAKIALRTAEIELEKKRWDIETNAINGWNSVLSAKDALRYAEDAEVLQRKTYNVSYQKYLHGLIDSLELQSAQVQLIQAQQSLLSTRINYLKALVDLDFLVGHTLKTWDIKVRY